ncbi:MAG: ABC transporter permease [Micromonosporaceae bacterium]|nr:ABC transporter permease [Micromonosporaceae bacterium]
MLGRSAGALPPVVFGLLLVAAWWAATAVLRVHPLVLPSPLAVAWVFLERGGYLWRSTLTTLGEAGLGYVIAAGLGVAVGTVLASWPLLARAVLPTLVGLDAVPKLALAPVLVVWLGFGPTPKVVIVVATCLLSVVLATMHGIAATPAEYVELARSLSASWWQRLVKFRLPWAVPRIFVGLRIAAPLCVIGAVVSEFFGATAGLGYAIRAAGSDMPLVYAALLILAAMSLSMFAVVVGAERLVAGWARQVTA